MTEAIGKNAIYGANIRVLIINHYICKCINVKRMDDRIKYWVEMAEYDFDTAKAMLDTKRYLYVGFMCHQVIEKMLSLSC